MKDLADKMLFEFEIVEPSIGKFGKKYPNGSWDGLISGLVTGVSVYISNNKVIDFWRSFLLTVQDTDIVIAPLKMTAEREESIDFVAPYFEQTGISIVMRNPIRETSLFKFMTVLRLEVWLSILGACEYFSTF